MAHTSTLFAILFLLLPAIALASVTSTNITRSTDPLSPELLEKTWTISASSIDKLEIQVAGNVFVDYDSSLESDDQVAAKIIMRASSPKLLQPVEASSIGNNEGLRLHYKNEQVHVEGLVTTEIRLSKPNALRSVSSSNAQNVVLTDNVVVTEDKEVELHFSTHGSGHLFIGSASGSFNVQSLGLIVSGDGGIQFQSSSLKIANELVVSLVGSGHVAVLAKDSLIANKVESAVAGTGKVVFQTPGFQAETIATEIVGNGDVTYQTSGICGDEKIRLAAEGSVNAASIVCKNADISILGTGEVVVQATERLSALLLLTGSVKYVNARPKSIQSSGIVLDSSIKPAEVVPSAQYTPLSPPNRAATGVFLTVEPANNHSSPYVHARPVVATTMRLQNLSASLPESMSALVLFEVALVAMAFTSFSVFKFQQRRIRNKYQTLLP